MANIAPSPCDNCTVANNNTTINATKNVTLIPVKPVKPPADIKITYFYQDNCEYCAQMAPTIDQLAMKYNVTRIDVTDHTIAAQYGISGTPTTIITNGVNNKSLRIDGVATYGMVVEDVIQVGG